MTKVLTARAVEGIKPDPDKRLEIPDGGVRGLYLVVQPSGARSWAVRYRHAGKPAKLTLGPALAERTGGSLDHVPIGAAMTLVEARTEARAALAAVSEGRDPAGERRAARTAATAPEDATRDHVRTLGTAFIDRYARPRNRSWRETERQLKVDVYPRWGDRRVQDITRRDVVDLLDGIVDRGSPVAANRVLATLRKFFGWLVARDVLPASPVTGVKAPSAEVSRDRVLSDDELALFWRASASIGYPFGPLFRLLAVTGQRREEVAAMARAELDLSETAPIWTIPAARSKNGEAHVVPLSPLAAAIIMDLPVLRGKAGLLFTSTGETPVSGFSKAKDRLDAGIVAMQRKAAVERGGDPDAIDPLRRWTLHDLRRTMASGMARLGINLPVIEKVLNHTSGSFGGIVGVYQRHTFADEKRAALNAWANFVEALVSEKPADNVVNLPARAAER